MARLLASTGHHMRLRPARVQRILLAATMALLLLCGCVMRCGGVESDATKRSLPPTDPSDGGADMGADEASPSTTPAQDAEAGAGAAVAATPDQPSVTLVSPTPSGPLHNDRTTHISYSDDSSEETHCTRTGPCTECSAEEKTEAYCLPTGMRQQVTCVVVATSGASNQTDAAAAASHAGAITGGAKTASPTAAAAAAASDPASAPGVRRSYIQQTSCEGDGGGSGSFWAFQFLCVVGLASGMWLLRKRRRVVQARHHRRLDRLVNS